MFGGVSDGGGAWQKFGQQGSVVLRKLLLIICGLIDAFYSIVKKENSGNS